MFVLRIRPLTPSHHQNGLYWTRTGLNGIIPGLFSCYAGRNILHVFKGPKQRHTRGKSGSCSDSQFFCGALSTTFAIGWAKTEVAKTEVLVSSGEFLVGGETLDEIGQEYQQFGLKTVIEG